MLLPTMRAGYASQDKCGFRGGDTNLRRYVHNNPPNLTDPSGLADKTVETEVAISGYDKELEGLPKKFKVILEGFTEQEAKILINSTAAIYIHTAKATQRIKGPIEREFKGNGDEAVKKTLDDWFGTGGPKAAGQLGKDDYAKILQAFEKILRAPKRMSVWHVGRTLIPQTSPGRNQSWPSHSSAMPCGNGSNPCYRPPSPGASAIRVANRWTGARCSPASSLF